MGFLTFDMSGTYPSTWNEPMPSPTLYDPYQQPDLAPFWDYLNTSKGTLWWEYLEGEIDRVIVQWTGMDLMSPTNAVGADLNFQIVLAEDGTFEFRYGTMEGPTAHANALEATIGAQDRAGRIGTTLVFNTEQKPGLEGRVYRFRTFDDFLEDASTPVPT